MVNVQKVELTFDLNPILIFGPVVDPRGGVYNVLTSAKTQSDAITIVGQLLAGNTRATFTVYDTLTGDCLSIKDDVASESTYRVVLRGLPSDEKAKEKVMDIIKLMAGLAPHEVRAFAESLPSFVLLNAGRSAAVALQERLALAGATAIVEDEHPPMTENTDGN